MINYCIDLLFIVGVVRGCFFGFLVFGYRDFGGFGGEIGC